MTTAQPKRLIEVDLPIREISAHARREKSIRHGHISTLHIWWARRPLAACRAVICASLWPDPADPACPPAFREGASSAILRFGVRVRDEGLKDLVGKRIGYWTRLTAKALRAEEKPESPDEAPWRGLRKALLTFIADFSNWDASTRPGFVETARAITQLAHETMGGAPGTSPLVFDPFAGGGAIPLEALRVGCESVATDYNPIPVILNKVILEYIPAYGAQLADALHEVGELVRATAAQTLAPLYPGEADGSVPLAWFWARTVACEGPGCGVEYPLVRNTFVNKKAPEAHFKIRFDAGTGRVEVDVVAGKESKSTATIRQGKPTCPRCGYTIPEKRLKALMMARHGGAYDARLLAVLLDGPEGRRFVAPRTVDEAALAEARRSYELLPTDRLPDEAINPLRPWKNTVGVCIVTRIGVERFRDLYTARQAVSLVVLEDAVRVAVSRRTDDPGLAVALRTCLHLAVDRLVMQNTSLSRWHATGSKIEGMFSKQALQIVWDFVESNPVGHGSANWDGAIAWIEKIVREGGQLRGHGTALRSAAADCPLPDDSAAMLCTDPPYFAAVPYADLSDVFYVWMRRAMKDLYPDLFRTALVDKSRELVVTNSALGPNGEPKDAAFFTKGMTDALTRARQIVRPDGIACIVFAETQTESWEALVRGVIQAGWTITGSWPIDTEMENRTRARNSASLQSSVFLICRPREDAQGNPIASTGDWREVLRQLPERIHSWMVKLSAEGIVGADAIFACLGPALEVYSRYATVVKVSGEEVELSEFLRTVWEAVSKEALSLILRDADTGGLEEDARLTAMWLWTLLPRAEQPTGEGEADDEDEEDDEEQPRVSGTGFSLDYDSARKIAQGLGVRLERLSSVVETGGKVARLRAVQERTRDLFGKKAPPADAKVVKPKQVTLFQVEGATPAATSDAWGELEPAPAATLTTLDRVHQAMILFAAGRSEALRRLVVDDGIGRDPRFWKLASALAPLYPRGSDERRWVEGLLGRKKALGFV